MQLVPPPRCHGYATGCTCPQCQTRSEGVACAQLFYDQAGKLRIRDYPQMNGDQAIRLYARLRAPQRATAA